MHTDPFRHACVTGCDPVCPAARPPSLILTAVRVSLHSCARFAALLRPSPPPKWHMCSASSVAAVQKSDVDVVRYTATQVSKLTPQLTFLKSQHEGEILRTQIYLACLPDILNTPTQPNHHHQSPPKASHLAAGSIQIAREG